MAASTAIPNAPASQTSAGRGPAVPLRCRSVLSLLILGGFGILGCGESTITPPHLAPEQAYWALQLNQHAVMLALQPTYDTVQLTATPLSALGTPLTLPGTVTFKSLDTTVVTVSPTGLVTARGTATVNSPVRVIAALQDLAQGLTRTDTAMIAVTATVPAAIDTFSMQPVQGDSAKRALEWLNNRNGFDWHVHAVSVGSTVCSTQSCAILVYYKSSRPLIATMDSRTGHVTGLDTGHVVFTAQTLAYHQALRDAVEFRIGYMDWVIVGVFLTVVLGVLTVGFAAPKKLILGVGATILFCNNGNDQRIQNDVHPNQPIDVVFDHPEAVDSVGCGSADFGYLPPTGSGNIAPFGGDTTGDLFTEIESGNFACRRFPVPGVYHYHSALFPSDTYEIDIRPDPQ